MLEYAFGVSEQKVYDYTTRFPSNRGHGLSHHLANVTPLCSQICMGTRQNGYAAMQQWSNASNHSALGSLVTSQYHYNLFESCLLAWPFWFCSYMVLLPIVATRQQHGYVCNTSGVQKRHPLRWRLQRTFIVLLAHHLLLSYCLRYAFAGLTGLKLGLLFRKLTPSSVHTSN